nr:hypothetical protein CJLB15_00023 [Campylobacter phage CJLB-15]
MLIVDMSVVNHLKYNQIYLKTTYNYTVIHNNNVLIQFIICPPPIILMLLSGFTKYIKFLK